MSKFSNFTRLPLSKTTKVKQPYVNSIGQHIADYNHCVYHIPAGLRIARRETQLSKFETPKEFQQPR